jgi:hypothetical protein
MCFQYYSLGALKKTWEVLPQYPLFPEERRWAMVLMVFSGKNKKKRRRKHAGKKRDL